MRIKQEGALSMENLFKSLTQDQIDKGKSCASFEELVTLAKNEGIELSDEQLEALSGGSVWDYFEDTTATCSECGGETTWRSSDPAPIVCPHCGHLFNF